MVKIAFFTRNHARGEIHSANPISKQNTPGNGGMYDEADSSSSCKTHSSLCGIFHGVCSSSFWPQQIGVNGPQEQKKGSNRSPDHPAGTPIRHDLLVRSSIATDSSILILGVPVQKDMFSNDNGRSLNQRYGTETRDTTIILNRSNFDSLLVTKKRRSFGNNHMDALAGVGLSFGLVLSVAASVGMARDGNWIGASIPVGLAGVAVLLLKARMKNRLKPHIMYPLKE